MPKETEPESPMSPHAGVKVWFDSENAWVHWPAEEPEFVSWDSLLGVAIETTDEGPFVVDVYWHLASKDKVITYPAEATGAQEILQRLQKIPTFNNERLIRAMSCTDNETFILWDHAGRHE